VDTRRLARDERADLAAFLATLSPQQWQAPTLCPRWRVRDVVAHVISYHEQTRMACSHTPSRAAFGWTGSTLSRWRDTTRTLPGSCWRCWHITCNPAALCLRRDKRSQEPELHPVSLAPARISA